MDEEGHILRIHPETVFIYFYKTQCRGLSFDNILLNQLNILVRKTFQASQCCFY